MALVGLVCIGLEHQAFVYDYTRNEDEEGRFRYQ